MPFSNSDVPCLLHVFYISNLVAKAPGLDLGKKISNMLSNHEALTANNFNSPKRELYCNAMQGLLFILPANSCQKNGFYIPMYTSIQ